MTGGVNVKSGRRSRLVDCHAVTSSVPVGVSARLAGSGSARRSTCGFPVAYGAAPATYVATIWVACRSRDARARSYRMVVLGSAMQFCERLKLGVTGSVEIGSVSPVLGQNSR